MSFQKKIDKYFGNLLILIFSIFSFFPKKKINEPKSILIVRLWTIGETLLTFPMISELRKKFPNVKIAVLCRNANKKIFEMKKDVDEIILFESNNIFSIFLKLRKFDFSIDTEPWFRISALLSFWLAKRRIGFSHGIRKLMYTELIGFNDKQYEADTFLEMLCVFGICKKFDSFKKLDVAKHEREKIERIFSKDKISSKDKLIGICPGVEDALYRMWLPAGFAAVSDYVIEKYKTKIIMIGSKNEFNLCEAVRAMSKNKNKIINLCGIDIESVFYLVEKMKFLIANDSGPMHIAAVQGTKTVSLFGPNLPVRFAPRTKGSIHLYHGDEKNPIINVHKGEIPESDNKKYFEPIEKITIDEVKKACDKLIRRN